MSPRVGLITRLFVAGGVDLAAIAALAVGLTELLGGPNALVALTLAAAYYIGLEGTYGQTAGKRLLALRVQGPDGGVPGYRRAAIRFVLRLVDYPLFCLVALVAMLSSGGEQRLGDMVADTAVRANSRLGRSDG